MTGEDISCGGKKVFYSYWSAERAAKRLNKFSPSAKANPYRCDYCRYFHVGNTMGTKRKQVASRHTAKEGARRGRIEFSA